MKYHSIKTSTLIAAAVIAQQALAADVKPFGQIHLQADYHHPKIADGARWSMSMEQSRIGLIAAEQLSASLLQVRLDTAINPLAADVIDPEDYLAYLSWQTNVVTISAGRMATLQQALLVDETRGQYSTPEGGYSIANYFPKQAHKAVRADAGYGDSMVLSAQWLVDELQSETPWSLASVVQTAEGSIAVTYRNAPGEEALWGNRITWQLETGALSYSWVAQDGMLAWDLSARTTTSATETFVTYSAQSTLTAERWTFGVQRGLSPSVNNYYELHWWPDDERWLGSAGLRMTF